MADSIKVCSESQSLYIEDTATNISKEQQMPYSNEIHEVLGYGGQRDPDPNQIECFLTNPKETEKDARIESWNNLLCQVCKANFDGPTSRQKLLEHINLVHSFNVCGKDSEEYGNDFSGVENADENLGEKKIVIGGNVIAESERLKSEKCLEKANGVVFSIVKDVPVVKKKASNNCFKCYICSTEFDRTSDFKTHLTSLHSSEIDVKDFDDLSYRCKKCASTFPNFLLLRRHFFKKHTTLIIYRCVVCHVTSRTKKSLKIHYNSFHARKNKELHSCDECGKELTNLKALKAHIRLKHGQNHFKQGFRCRLCQQKFESMESRKVHYDEEHLGESPFMCTDCGKGFSSKSGLYGHRQLHKTEQVFTCPYCEKIFNRRDSYHEHILIHIGPKHRCPHCPKEFVQRSNLVRHIRIHTGQKPYGCTFCEKRFSDKGACNSHIRVHTKEEQCACPYCGQTFTKKQKLKYHIRKHTGEGLLSCEICSKTFTNSFALKEHRAIHDRQTQTICVECGKAFNSAKYLQRHIALVHQESRDSRAASLYCPICAKPFCHQARLKSHLVTHLGKKHLQCLICEKRYSSMKSIRNHLQQSHDVRPNQPEFKKFIRSAFENAQISLTPIESSFVSSSGDEKTFSNDRVPFTIDKTVEPGNGISNTSYNKFACDAEMNSDYRESSDEEKKPTNIFINEVRDSRQLQSDFGAIIEDRIKVKEDRSNNHSEDNGSNKFLQDSESVDYFPIINKETKLSPEYLNSEISRRRKQLRTPKKYVSYIENFQTIDHNLKNVIPKRERVEAIARSLKEATNFGKISVEEDEKEEQEGEEVEEEKK